MGSSLQTRGRKQRALVVNALTKPLNVAVPAVVLVAGLLLHLLVLFVPIALVIYAALAWTTLFDDREAKRVLSPGEGRDGGRRAARELPPGLPPELGEPLRSAVAEEGKLRAAVEEAKLPFDDVTAEVSVLMDEMQRVAAKGATIHAYLTDEDVAGARARLERLRRQRRRSGAVGPRQMALEALESQVRIQDELANQFKECVAELEHLSASLGVIRGQVVRMRVAEDASVQEELAGQVRDLRTRVTTVADALTDAYGEIGTGT